MRYFFFHISLFYIFFLHIYIYTVTFLTIYSRSFLFCYTCIHVFVKYITSCVFLQDMGLPGVITSPMHPACPIKWQPPESHPFHSSFLEPFSFSICISFDEPLSLLQTWHLTTFFSVTFGEAFGFFAFGSTSLASDFRVRDFGCSELFALDFGKLTTFLATFGLVWCLFPFCFVFFIGLLIGGSGSGSAVVRVDFRLGGMLGGPCWIPTFLNSLTGAGVSRWLLYSMTFFPSFIMINITFAPHVVWMPLA